MVSHSRRSLAATLVCAALVASQALPLSACGTGGDAPSAPDTQIVGTGEAATPTKVRGVKAKIARTRSQKATDKITVSPAWGRTVELQYLDPASGQWQTQQSYTTADREKASLTLDYGNSWKSHMASTWRVHVPAAQGASEYAKTVKLRLSDLALSCKAAVVMDAETGQLVFDYKARSKRKIASMTKMMTAILLVEGKSLDERVKVASAAAKVPWGIGLVKGDTVTARDLLYAMMLPSANDAAAEAGIAVAGSTKAFVQRMDQRAADLGCTDTVYKNANGLDKKGAHSTALDQARIGRYLMTDSGTGAIRKAVRTWKKKFKSKKGIVYRLENTDKLLKAKGKYKALGVKTGSTDDAGCCFTGCFEVGGRTLVTVELGAKSDEARWQATRELVDIAAYAGKHGLAEYDL